MKKSTFTPLTKTTVLAALLVAGSLLASFGADDKPTIVKIGSASIRLISPEGYADCSDENNRIRNFAENFCPPGNRLLGVFGSKEFCRAALAGETSSAFDYALVEISRGAVWDDASVSDFTEVKSSVKREQNTLFSQADPDIKDAINRLNRSMQNATGEKVSLNLDQPVALGVFDEGHQHVSMMILMQMQLKSGGKSETHKVAASVSLVHVKGKVIFVYAYRAYTGEQSVTELKKFTTEWMAMLTKANE